MEGQVHDFHDSSVLGVRDAHPDDSVDAPFFWTVRSLRQLVDADRGTHRRDGPGSGRGAPQCAHAGHKPGTEGGLVSVPPPPARRSLPAIERSKPQDKAPPSPPPLPWT